MDGPHGIQAPAERGQFFPPLKVPGRYALWLLLLAILWHGYLCIAAIGVGSSLWDDSIQYLTLADNLLNRGIFSQQYQPPWLPDTQRTPGYPVWLALMGLQIPVILVVQHLLVLLSAWWLYGTLRMHAPKEVAIAVGWLWAFLPYPALFASSVLTEALFIPLLIGLIYLFALPGISLGRSIAGGLVGAVLVLVKPLGLVVCLGLAGFEMLQKKRRRYAVIWIGLVLLLLLPWQYRVWQLAGQWSLSTGGSITTVYGKLGGTLVGAAPDSTLVLQTNRWLADHQPLHTLYTHTGEENQEFTRLTHSSGTLWPYWMAHPGAALRFHAESLGNMWMGSGYGAARLITGGDLLSKLCAGVQLGVNAGLLLGSLLVLFAWRRIPLLLRHLWIVGLLLLLAHATAWADGRYRTPADALLSGACAYAWYWLYQKIRRPMPSSSLGKSG
ncbi:MAG: hypothetical protein KF690_08170 [Bacteroidetes bacterium]|nr:hypothetical protein [Bacteroidota bacterium]